MHYKHAELCEVVEPGVQDSHRFRVGEFAISGTLLTLRDTSWSTLW